MAIEQAVWDRSFIASTTETRMTQWSIVKRGTEGTITLCVSATGSSAGAAVGILQNDPANGEAAIVRVIGLSKAIAGAALAVGEFFQCSTGGTCAAAATSQGMVLGQVESASTAAAQIISVWLSPRTFTGA